jgi:predicted transcriptional regulator
MGRAQAGDAWITIMSNVNIVAVATLADPACIVLSEGVAADEGVVAKAESVGVNILSSDEDTFSVSAKISRSI